MQNWIGKHIWKCRIDEEIGSGGMGTVYKATHLLLQKAVALKILHSDLLRGDVGQEIVARFLREARSAARLEHPNVIPIYDFGEEDGNYYIVMQYMPGKNLLQFICDCGSLEPQDVLMLCKEVAKGLGAAHRAGIIHRDIKPANILLGEDSIKITDFGTARELYDDAHLSQTGRVFGTPLYLSPEQVMGEKNLDGRVDLYALGATLYHALLGKPPYDGETSFVIMQHHVYSPLPPVCEKLPHVPKEIEHLIHKLMEKKRENRFASAEEVVAYAEYLENSLYATQAIPSKTRVSKDTRGTTRRMGGQARTKKRKLAQIRPPGYPQPEEKVPEEKTTLSQPKLDPQKIPRVAHLSPAEPQEHPKELAGQITPYPMGDNDRIRVVLGDAGVVCVPEKVDLRESPNPDLPEFEHPASEAGSTENKRKNFEKKKTISKFPDPCEKKTADFSPSVLKPQKKEAIRLLPPVVQMDTRDLMLAKKNEGSESDNREKTEGPDENENFETESGKPTPPVEAPVQAAFEKERAESPREDVSVEWHKKTLSVEECFFIALFVLACLVLIGILCIPY